MNRDFKTEIRQAAKEWEALRAQIDLTLPSRGESQDSFAAWQAACHAWHGYERPVLNAFWSGDGLERLEAGELEMRELAICFVETDPYYFRSGYLKKRLFRRLRRIIVSDAEKKRVQQGILDALRFHRGDGWKDFCALATAFSDANFEQSVSRFVAHDDVYVSRRAAALLARLRKPKVP